MSDDLWPRLEVARVAGVPGAALRDHWYGRGQPVVIDDLDVGGAATWTPEHLAAVLGATEVEVMQGWRSTPAENTYLELDAHRTRMRFDEYAAAVTSGTRDDLYMVANNPFFATAAGTPLFAELGSDPRYLQADRNQSFLWFGPPGTVTHLHYDVVSVLFAQIRGVKRWTLIPPAETPRLYNTVGVYSAVDVTAPDLDAHPLFAGVLRADFDLGPGQALLVPAGWWHAVQGLSPAISVSYTGFLWGNAPIAVQPAAAGALSWRSGAFSAR